MAMKQQTLAERLKRDSHRICSLILNSDLEWIDIAIEINRMREACAEEAPEKLELFEALYVGRFTRLWDQWRHPQEEEDNAWQALFDASGWKEEGFDDDEFPDDRGLEPA